MIFLHSKEVQYFVRKTLNKINLEIKNRNRNGYFFLECYVDTPSKYPTKFRKRIREEIKKQLFDAGYYVEVKPDRDFDIDKAYFGKFFIQWGEVGTKKRMALFKKN